MIQSTSQASKTNWPEVVLIVSSLVILLLITGAITAVVRELNVRDGVYDTTLMNSVFFGAVYCAVPCGLLNVFVGNNARSRNRVRKKLAVMGIVLGVVGILIGLFSWAWLYMITSFVF